MKEKIVEKVTVPVVDDHLKKLKSAKELYYHGRNLDKEK